MTYREEGDAWLAKRMALSRAVATEGDFAIRERMSDELDAMDRARRLEAKRALPLVASARIASPCFESFEAMSGTGAIRSCARCDEQVFDLAQMTLAQAEGLIAGRGGKLCARLLQRSDGTMMFSDCTVGAQGVRARRAGGVIAAALVSGLAIAAAPHDHPRPPPPHAPVATSSPLHDGSSPLHDASRYLDYSQAMGQMQIIPPAPSPVFAAPSERARLDPNDPLARFSYDGVDPVTGQRGYGALLTR